MKSERNCLLFFFWSLCDLCDLGPVAAISHQTESYSNILDPAGAIVLVQTIWGLDLTTPVYPNMVVTGPVLPPATHLRDRLAKEHGELHKFLRASSGGVVYVTTGSLAKLHDWQVRVLYKGLKKTKFRVVWSLKEDQQKCLPVKDWTKSVQITHGDVL